METRLPQSWSFFLFKTKMILYFESQNNFWIIKSSCTENLMFPCFTLFTMFQKTQFIDVILWILSPAHESSRAFLNLFRSLTRSMRQTLFTYAFTHWRTRIWRQLRSKYRDAFLFFPRAVFDALPQCRIADDWRRHFRLQLVLLLPYHIIILFAAICAETQTHITQRRSIYLFWMFV